MTRKFQRTIENFTCLHCGRKVTGNGYTNHCPACLWSLHVDNQPGDRSNFCGALMEPVAAYFQKGEWHIRHRCVKCHAEKNNRLSSDDDMSSLNQIIQKMAKNK